MNNHRPLPNVCDAVRPLVNDLAQRADEYGVLVSKGEMGCTIIDCGIECHGSLRTGLRVAEICMGGLGHITHTALPHEQKGMGLGMGLHVTASHAVIACLGSQYAGWNLSTDDYYALGSGPARAVAQREELFQDIDYQASSSDGTLVLEVSKPPPAELVSKAANDCNIKPDHLTFILTPTTSIVGTVQIVARALEVALHKAHTVKFDVKQIIDGAAYAPLPPPAPDTIAAMGRANDAIIYGGIAHLFVDSSDNDAKNLARVMPSKNARHYGKPFAQIFKRFKGDFYAIDRSLFSPARVIVTSLKSGNSFEAGRVNNKILARSFGY